MELIEHPPILRVPYIPDQVLYMWIVMAVLVVVSIVATRRLHLVPHGTQNMRSSSSSSSRSWTRRSGTTAGAICPSSPPWVSSS